MTLIAASAVQEVKSLHSTFVELFTGRSSDLGRCARALAEDFWMITPDGRCLSRDETLAGIASKRAASDFRISIDGIRVIHDFGDSVLLHYIEEQYLETKTTCRLASALFSAEANAPCGVVWRYLHETWMQYADGQM
jgi:hypothetical protein